MLCLMSCNKMVYEDPACSADQEDLCAKFQGRQERVHSQGKIHHCQRQTGSEVSQRTPLRYDPQLQGVGCWVLLVVET
jgi:hypothetical protein